LIIAIASENEQVIAFGGTPEFTVFKVEGTHQREREVVPMKRLFGVELATLLVKLEIDLVICKAIDTASKRALSEAGIHLVSGVSGSVDTVYKGYLAGNLNFEVFG
jgi:predicted Fe-Mo cluster-binding NifX family protein